MLLAPDKGFVFLAPPKTATTAIEHAFGPHAGVALQKNPFKHTNYAQFQRFLQPWLQEKGFPRASYEVVCVVREPIDWLSSWWRYRSREALSRPGHPKHHNYAGNLSFEQFARVYMGAQSGEKAKGGRRFVRVGRPSRFVRPMEEGAPGVDLLFRYERLDLLVAYLNGKVGKSVEVEVRNVSPPQSHSLSEECERDLRAFFAPEYEMYEKAIGA